jgi:hypothetical protein
VLGGSKPKWPRKLHTQRYFDAEPEGHAGLVEYRGSINAAVISRTEELLTRTIFKRLDAAIMKCQLAKSPLVSDALMQSAQRTYDEFDRFVWRFKLKHELFDQITAKMERLRFEIDATKLIRDERK